MNQLSQIDRKKAAAARILTSWLKACGIQIPQPCFLADTDEIPEGTFCVPVDGMASYEKEVALQVFYTLTELYGHGSPVPVDRGNIVSQHGTASDAILTPMRHRELHLAPNLTKQKMEFYRPVVLRLVGATAANFRNLLQHHGYEREDLETYAWCWCCIFVHKSETGVEKDDKRLLAAFLRQRFGYLMMTLQKKRKSTLPDLPTAVFSLTGEAAPGFEDFELMDPEERRQNSVDSVARDLASKRFLAALKTLSCEELNEKLETAISDDNNDSFTKSIARRHLSNHRKSCSLCSKEPVVETRDKQLGPSNALGLA